MTSRLRSNPILLSLLAAVLGASLLTACGGGGSDASTSGGSSASPDDTTATAYAANATQMGSDGTTAADTAVLAAQAMVPQATATAAQPGMSSALAVQALATATVPRNCPGGGTASVSVTGGTAASVLNGQLDPGEVYTLSFTGCSGSAGATAVDGSLVMTVVSLTGNTSNGTLALSLVANNLSVQLPRGSVALNGNLERTVTVSTDTDGTVHASSHWTTPSLTLTTHYNARSSIFTLSALDITRTATLVGGVPQSSTISGTYTLAAALPLGSFSYTVATNGTVTYSASGVPMTGQWTITLPQTLIGVSVANSGTTITIDQGKDGTIDRTIALPALTLVTDAG